MHNHGCIAALSWENPGCLLWSRSQYLGWSLQLLPWQAAWIPSGKGSCTCHWRSRCVGQGLRNTPSISAISVKVCKHPNQSCRCVLQRTEGWSVSEDRDLVVRTCISSASWTGLACESRLFGRTSARWSWSQDQCCSECTTEFRGHGCDHKSDPSFFLLDPFEEGCGLVYRAIELAAVSQPEEEMVRYSSHPVWLKGTTKTRKHEGGDFKDLALRDLLTVDGLLKAEKEIIRFCQRMSYPDELKVKEVWKGIVTSSNSLLCWRKISWGLVDD